jgi:hypothetical protein
MMRFKTKLENDAIWHLFLNLDQSRELCFGKASLSG